MIIRKAVKTDVELMLGEGIKFLKFVYPDKEVDTQNLRYILWSLTHQGTVLVAEDKGKVVGAIAGAFKTNIFYPSEVELQELFWWVIPEYRSSSAAYRLFNAFIQFGKDEGVNRILMHKEPHNSLNEDAYEKRGFNYSEKVYVMEV
jgi:GNAT superfamily N-acetyltransferase